MSTDVYCSLFIVSCLLLPFCLASRILFLDYCVPPHVYSFLLLACCFLFPVSCYLILDSCLFHIVSCFLLVIFQFVTLGSCFLYHVSRVRFLACLLIRASHFLNDAFIVCCFLFFACLMFIVCCLLFFVSCLFLLASCFLPLAWLGLACLA